MPLKKTWLCWLLLLAVEASASSFRFETSSCFTGIFETQQSFLDSAAASHPGGSLDSQQKRRLKMAYERWRRADQEQLDCRLFTYVVDQIPVTGFYLKPKGMATTELLPAIFNRGGNADGVIRTPYFYDKLAPLAEEGFLVVGSFYRGAAINGVPSPHRLRDEFGGADVKDVLALLPIITPSTA